jgi:hypothetical protein
MVGFEPDQVAALVRLPADHVLAFMIAIGRAVRPSGPKPGQLPLAEVVIHGRF